MNLDIDIHRNNGPSRVNTGTQSKEHSSNSFRNLAKLATLLSFLCSGVAVSLFVANFLGPKDLFEIKIVNEAWKCVHNILSASVVLGFLAMFLSSYKSDAKSNVVLVHTIKTLDRSTEVHPKTATEANEFKNLSKSEKIKAPPRFRSIQEKDDLKPMSNTEVKSKDSGVIPSSDQQCKKSVLPINPPPKHTALYPDKSVVPYQSKNAKASMNRSLLPGPASNRFPHQLWSLNITDVPQGKTVTEFVPSNTSRRYVGIHSMTEYVASNRVRYFSGEGKLQSEEEFKIKRITNFYPENNFLASSVQKTNLSKKMANPNRFGPSPQGDNVSDVITKMEALQFFY